MIITIIYVILSFLLDGLLSNYTGVDITNLSYLRTIYSLVSLVIIFSYFENQSKYLYILFILGLLFDIVYTNTFLINIVIFLIIYVILKQLDYYMPNNIITINIKSLVCIIIYHMLSYIILLISHFNNYPLKTLFIILSKNIIMTIIYTTISYLLIRKIYLKKYDKKIK